MIFFFSVSTFATVAGAPSEVTVFGVGVTIDGVIPVGAY